MWSISTSVRIFLAREPVDMRKSFHGLLSLTESVLKKDPLSGQLFVFINRRRDRIKLLYWGGVGFCIWYQQLQQGTYQLPSVLRLTLSDPSCLTLNGRPDWQGRSAGWAWSDIWRNKARAVMTARVCALDFGV